MALALIAPLLLKKEIEEMSGRGDLDKQEEFYLSVAKKELLLLEKLNVECDMRGTEQEVADRLEANILWILSPEDKEWYIKAYELYANTRIAMMNIEKPGI